MLKDPTLRSWALPLHGWPTVALISVSTSVNNLCSLWFYKSSKLMTRDQEPTVWSHWWWEKKVHVATYLCNKPLSDQGSGWCGCSDHSAICTHKGSSGRRTDKKKSTLLIPHRGNDWCYTPDASQTRTELMHVQSLWDRWAGWGAVFNFWSKLLPTEKLLLTKNERRMQRQEMIAFLAGCWRASDGFRFNKKINWILSDLSGLFRQNFLDPAEVFGYVNIDVGQIRVVTVLIHVERHNANRLLAAHQRTPRVALWGRRSRSHYYIIAVYWRLEQLFSLNGRTYLTES